MRTPVDATLRRFEDLRGFYLGKVLEEAGMVTWAVTQW